MKKKKKHVAINDDSLCANCGHPYIAHQKGEECFYQGSSLSSCEPCNCKHFEAEEDFNSKNPYAP